MEYILRFLLGGLIVSIFASIADVLRPKGFAGLFGAAPLRVPTVTAQRLLSKIPTVCDRYLRPGKIAA